VHQRRQAALERRHIADRLGQVRQHLGLEQRLPRRQRLLRHVAAGEHQDVEDEVADRRVRRAVVLEQAERGPALFVERDDLAVHDCVSRQVLQTTHHGGIALTEIVVVA
jgi:hypothetical protein